MFQKALLNAVDQTHQHTHNEQKIAWTFHLQIERTPFWNNIMSGSWRALDETDRSPGSLAHPRLEQPGGKTKRDPHVLSRSNFNPPCHRLNMLKNNLLQVICTEEQKITLLRVIHTMTCWVGVLRWGLSSSCIPWNVIFTGEVKLWPERSGDSGSHGRPDSATASGDWRMGTGSKIFRWQRPNKSQQTLSASCAPCLCRAFKMWEPSFSGISKEARHPFFLGFCMILSCPGCYSV